MKTIQQGFTLIELMIVVAIIGILAAIAIPQYNNYVAQSQISAALAEISGGKTQYENRLQRGDDAIHNGSLKAGDIGLQSKTSACSTIDVATYTSNSSAADNAKAEITCNVTGNPQVEGDTLSLDRIDSGAWVCITSNLPSDLLPGNCSS